MNILKIDSNTQSFGMKIPTKTAIEVATGCYLDNAHRSSQRQYKLFSKSLRSGCYEVIFRRDCYRIAEFVQTFKRKIIQS